MRIVSSPPTVPSISVHPSPSSAAAIFYCPIRYGVARAFGGRHPGEPQFSKISRESRLSRIPPTMKQQLSQIFLTAHQSRIDYLEYCRLPFALISHAVPPSLEEDTTFDHLRRDRKQCRQS